MEAGARIAEIRFMGSRGGGQWVLIKPKGFCRKIGKRLVIIRSIRRGGGDHDRFK